MQIKNIFLLVLLALSFNACQEDVIGETETVTINPEPQVTYSSTVKGIVTDENGNALPDVEVIYHNASTTTDINGFFKLRDIQGFEEGALLKLEKTGYFDNYKTFFPELNTTSFMRVVMVDRALEGQVSASSGGQIDIEGGARVTFPSDAFVREDGSNYSGQVSVYAHWYNPSSTQFAASMPGDLRAIDSENQLAQLASFGMLAVELESSSGDELQLKEEVEATMYFPVPASLQSSAPATIETWSLQEDLPTSAYWIEESTAELINGEYVGKASHFSFWNCDAPFPVVEIFGKLVDGDGNPLPYYSMCIVVLENAMTGYGWTDQQGGFRGKVPRDKTLELQVKDECGNIVYTQKMGPFSTSVSLGEIVIDLQKNVLIEGTLVDCDGNPVTNGYARIDLENDNIYYIAETNENGMFSIEIIKCSNIGAFTVQGFNFDDNTTSEILEVTNNDSEIDLGIISMCDQLDEFIRVKTNDGEIFISTDVEAKILDGNLLLQTLGDSLSGDMRFTMLIDGAQTGDNDDISQMMFVVENANSAVWAFCDDDGQQSPDCSDIVVTITSIGIVGDYAEGEFMGEVLYQSTGQTATIMGAFRVQIDEVAELGSISGQVWFDENENGIRDGSEGPVNIDRITLVDVSSGTGFFSFSNINNYSFDGLAPGDYMLNAFVGNQSYEITLRDQGSDDNIDSDFNPANGNTDVLNITSGLDIDNVDLGLKTSDEVFCEVGIISQDVCESGVGEVVVEIEGGTAPYTVEIFVDGALFNTYTGTDQTILFDFVQAGVIEVLVTDNQGGSCGTETQLSSVFPQCYVNVINSSCGQDNGAATVFVDPDLSNGNYAYNWSTGETSQEINELAPGTYIVTVTDLLYGCESVCDLVIEDESELFVTMTGQSVITCSEPVTLTVNVNGGQAPYVYLWSTGANTQTISVFSGGSYSVVVTDAAGCTGEAELFIEEIPELFVLPTVTPSRCGMDNGRISLIGQEGCGGYYYEWSNGVTWSSGIANLAPGEYEVVISDDCGCSIIEFYTIDEINYSDAVVGRVWLDSLGGNDNLYDVGEYLWPQLQVNLYDAMDLANPIASTITDGDGFYFFENLAGSDVVIGVQAPQGLEFVSANTGMDDDIDSDIDPITGQSAAITPGDCIRIDIGLKEQ